MAPGKEPPDPEEDRKMSHTMTEPLGPSPSMRNAIGGAAIGIVAASAWWIGVYGIRVAANSTGPGYFVMALGAVVAGALVGYLTVLCAGQRSLSVTVVAGIGGLLGVLNAAVLFGAPAPLRFLADILTKLPLVAPFIGRIVAQPAVLGFAMLAGAVAAAVAYLQLPSAFWHMPAENTPELPIAPAPAPAPEPAPVTPVAPVSHVAPASVAARPATIAPAIPTTPAQPARPTAPEFFKQHRALVLGGAAAIAAVLIAVSAFSLGRSGRDASEPDTTPQPAQTPAPPPAETPAPTQPAPEVVPPPQPTETSNIPEDAVEMLYTRAAEGDFDGAREAFSPGFDLEPGVFEKWGDPDWEFTTVIGGVPREGSCVVGVHESSGGWPGKDDITWIVREEGSTWEISGWYLGKPEDAARVLKESEPPTP